MTPFLNRRWHRLVIEMPIHMAAHLGGFVQAFPVSKYGETTNVVFGLL
jgi:hypothetical protein